MRHLPRRAVEEEEPTRLEDADHFAQELIGRRNVLDQAKADHRVEALGREREVRRSGAEEAPDVLSRPVRGAETDARVVEPDVLDAVQVLGGNAGPTPDVEDTIA